MNNIIRKIAIAVVVIFGIISFSYHFYLTKQIYAYAPNSPNYESGEFIEMKQHGVVFYVTERDNILYFISIPIGIGSLMLATFISRVWKPNS